MKFLRIALIIVLTLCISKSFALTDATATDVSIKDPMDSTEPESSSPNTTNIITITPAGGVVTTSVPDSTINMNVQNKLSKNPFFDASGLTATTASGTVKLQGHVNTQADLVGAVNAVRSVDGVVSVDISSVSIGTETSSPAGDSSTLSPESSY